MKIKLLLRKYGQRKRYWPCVCLLLLLSSSTGLEAQFGEKIQYFPHFAIGGGSTTLFTIHNPGSVLNPIVVDIELYRSNGSSFLTESVGLGGGETKTVAFGGEPNETVAGWAKLSSTGEFAASELFKIAGFNNVGVLPSDTTSELKIFAFVSSQTRTGFAIANPSETSQSAVTVQMFDTQGVFQGQASKTLGPLEHFSVFLDENPYSMDSDGSVTLSASESVIAVTLRLDGGTQLAGVPVITPSDEVMAVGPIDTESLVDGAVTTSKIADAAVTASKIANSAVGSDQLGDFVNFRDLAILNSDGQEVLALTSIDGVGAIGITDSEGDIVLGMASEVGGRGLAVKPTTTELGLIGVRTAARSRKGATGPAPGSSSSSQVSRHEEENSFMLAHMP